jgi:hypothetical protein
MTNISGDWTSGIGQETQGTTGGYTQTWYVNGVALTPSNPDPDYFPFAPSLPFFAVEGNVPPNSPPVLNSANTRGGNNNVTAKWIWTPVSYVSNTSYGGSVTDAAAQSWNLAQSTILLQSSSNVRNIWFNDDSTLPRGTYARTYSYTQGCNTTCYNQVDVCNGACADATALFHDDVYLNTSTINGSADALGWSHDTEATYTLAHELGHALQLGEATIYFGTCSETGSIMSAIAELCGVYAPSSSDINVFNSVYPVAPGYCTPGNNRCDGTPC